MSEAPSEPPVAPPSVLFVGAGRDAPFRYRCEQPAAQLRSAGGRALATVLADPRLETLLDGATLLVLFRLPWSEAVARLVERARGLGIPVAYDTDDLVFDASVAGQMLFVQRLPEHRRRGYAAQFELQRRTLAAADVVVASTPVIARYAERAGKPAIVHRNALPRAYERLGAVLAPLRAALLGSPSMGYFSGSETHDGDLASIEPVLVRALERHRDLLLVLGGHLGPPASLEGHPRVVRLPFLDYRALPFVLARLGMVLAPVEAVNDFASAKSAIRVTEPAALGVPAVASPADEYAGAIVDGDTGHLARSEQDWDRGIDDLVARERSLRCGRAARRKALREHGSRPRAAELTHALARFGRPQAADASAWPSPRAGARERATAAWRLAKGVRLLATPLAALELPAPRIVHATVLPGRGAGVEEAGGVTLSGRNPHAVTLAGVRVSEHGLESTGGDPQVIWATPARAVRVDQVLVELRVATPGGTAWGELFWALDGAAFRADRAWRFDVAADGGWRTYAWTTTEAEARALAGGALTAVRLDPLDQPGVFEVGTVALVAAGGDPGKTAKPVDLGIRPV